MTTPIATAKLNSYATLRGAIVAGLVVLLLIGGGAWWTVSKNVQALNSVAHSYQVLDRLNELLVAALNTKAWSNSYALSGNESYLTSYRQAEHEFHQNFDETRNLTKDDPRQQTRLDNMTPAMAQAATLQKELIQLRRDGDTAEIEAFIPKSDEAIKQLRDMVEQMKDEEERLLAERSTASNNAQSLTTEISKVVIFVTLLAAVMAIIAGVMLNRLLRQQAMGEQTRRHLAALIESSVDPIISKDLTGTVTSWNPAAEKMFGYTAEEAVGKPVTMLIPADRLREEADIIRHLMRGETVEQLQTIRLTKDAVGVEVSATISPIKDAAGHVIGASKILRDVTRSNQLTAALRAANDALMARAAALDIANKELESFSYSVSHDLRAPLRAIDGFSRLLEEEHNDRLGENGRDCTKRIRKAAQRMAALIDDMLNLSRITRADIARRQVDLSALVVERAKALQDSAPERNAKFDIPPGLTAEADPRLLGIALDNLLENAWKFTSRTPQTKIEFGQEQANGSRAYFVRDNGVGFEMKYADKLFDPFQRLHDNADFPGTGIGLATIQRIISKHGGEVWVNAKPNEGATFYFTL
jgi:PAS domain S-box-containing protein